MSLRVIVVRVATLVGVGMVFGMGSAAAQPEDPEMLHTRVVDAGAGLCTVTAMPGGFYMVYDAGDLTDVCLEGVQEIVPEGEEIDLMVLSHSDADHLRAVNELLDEYRVRKVVRTGSRRLTLTWAIANRAIRKERREEGLVDIEARRMEEGALEPGFPTVFGETTVIQVAGFHEPPSEWGRLSKSEKRNAISIVVRVEYDGRSILFTGDTVGRHIDDDESVCIAAEQFMVSNADTVPIRSDVLIAPHHGADNGSSACFIEAVDPTFVIFSAGNRHGHPTAAAAGRYLKREIPEDRILRTDAGDFESDEDHWTQADTTGLKDPARDDDVDIFIPKGGELIVRYRRQGGG